MSAGEKSVCSDFSLSKKYMEREMSHRLSLAVFSASPQAQHTRDPERERDATLKPYKRCSMASTRPQRDTATTCRGALSRYHAILFQPSQCGVDRGLKLLAPHHRERAQRLRKSDHVRLGPRGWEVRGGGPTAEGRTCGVAPSRGHEPTVVRSLLLVPKLVDQVDAVPRREQRSAAVSKQALRGKVALLAHY